MKCIFVRIYFFVIEGLVGAGLEGLTQNQIRKAAIHDVTPEFVTNIKATGLQDVTINNLIEFQIHDVTPNFISRLKISVLRCVAAMTTG